QCAHPDLPLSYLDLQIRPGNSLIGGLPQAVGRSLHRRDMPVPELPDEAFDPVEGDDRKAAGLVKKRNRNERGGVAAGAASQGTMQPHGGELQVLKPPTRQEWDAYSYGMATLTEWPEGNLDSVARKHQRFAELRASLAYRHRKLALDLWTAAFF